MGPRIEQTQRPTIGLRARATRLNLSRNHSHCYGSLSNVHQSKRFLSLREPGAWSEGSPHARPQTGRGRVAGSIARGLRGELSSFPSSAASRRGGSENEHGLVRSGGRSRPPGKCGDPHRAAPAPRAGRSQAGGRVTPQQRPMACAVSQPEVLGLVAAHPGLLHRDRPRGLLRLLPTSRAVFKREEGGGSASRAEYRGNAAGQGGVDGVGVLNVERRTSKKRPVDWLAGHGC